MLPGIIGSIQALEAIKVILGITPNLSGKLLLYNGLSHTMEQIELNV
jgi:adenylyltransferase/sulfurtransferase